MPRQIFLFSNVDQYSAEIIVRQLLEYDRQSHDEITMFINSPGGYVTQLFSIIDAMNLVQSPIRTVVIGQAASCAAIIAAHGDTRLITEKSEFMLHEVWNFMIGSYTEIEEGLGKMNQMQATLLGILSKDTGKSEAEIKDVIKKKDAYFNAEQAVAFGLADRIINPSEAQIYKLSESINVEGSEINYKSEGLSEVEILKSGQFHHPSYGNVVITEQTLNQMLNNFNNRVRGIDISFDYTHDNETGEQPAAFWVKSLSVKDKAGVKVLTAQAEFTPKGRKAILEKEYKYASADFCIDYVNESGKHFPYVLRGGTLTNRPFIKEMNPIKLSEYKPKKEEIKKMDKQQLMNALKEHGVDVSAIEAQNATLNARISDMENKIKELNALPAQKEAEITNLKAKISELDNTIVSNEKDVAFNSLLEEGKVIPAQKDKVLGIFENAKEMSEFYKDAPVIVNKTAKGGNGDGEDETLTDAELAVVNSGKYTKEEIIAGRTLNYNKKPAKKETK